MIYSRTCPCLSVLTFLEIRMTICRTFSAYLVSFAFIDNHQRNGNSGKTKRKSGKPAKASAKKIEIIETEQENKKTIPETTEKTPGNTSADRQVALLSGEEVTRERLQPIGASNTSMIADGEAVPCKHFSITSYLF